MWVILAFLLVCSVWCAVALVVRRISRLRQRNQPAVVPAFALPPWGYKTVGELPFRGVIWRMRVPAVSPWQRDLMDESGSDGLRVDVELPPRCPKCGTEIEETETFFGKYRWTCIQCGYAVKNALSYDYEVSRAERLGQARWEKLQEQERKR